jgi:AraC-like DNA-binding protein
VLNKGANANFNNYINSYRIEAFKEKIKAGQYQTHTLASLAYDCGFDSKSTFNRVFKLTCGITPSAYVKMTQNPALD